MAHSVHIPLRTCLVCGMKNAKFALLRIALSPLDATLILDPKQRMAGRGAYSCPGCLPHLSYSRRVQKAFRNKAKGLAEGIGR